MVTDNGSNFVKASKLVADAVPSLPCFAHTLQLTIREGIAQTSYLSKILKNGTDIVTFYHRSQPSLENLHASQKKLGLHEKKLVTAIETRWNSEYVNEKRLFENREPLMWSLYQLKSNIFRSSEEWEKVSQFLAILKPFYEATVISSGKNISVCHE